MTSPTQPQTTIASPDAPGLDGLTYASCDAPGITRHRAGKGFRYRDAEGAPLADRAALARIRALVIPPAWVSVWICPDPNGHIQAVGRDERGRRQYRYHPRFRELRDDAKFQHIIRFAESLPMIRRRVAADMAKPGLGRDKVLATVAHLLETTMIRVGNEEYAKTNKSYGLTTLLTRHVSIDGAELRFHFKGKSGKTWKLNIRDRRVARIVKSCQDLPGQHLFQYVDDAGERQNVSSADINQYLRDVSGTDVTAKDFRTWTGTVLAALFLAQLEPPDSASRAKRNVVQAVDQVSALLGNTPTICRKCYIHPEIVTAYLEGRFAFELPDGQAQDDGYGLRPEEAAVLAFLRAHADGEAVRGASGDVDPVGEAA